MIESVKGMKDYYPTDWSEVRFVRDTWLTLGRSYGYEEFEGPALESMELYIGKTNQEIINEQTFLALDKNGNELIMRPELTPTLARMVAQREYELSMPLKWQSFGRFFRYEKPQRGRSRAFFQWNIDLIGIDSIYADIEMLQLVVESMRRLGLTPREVQIKINNREALQKALVENMKVEVSQVPNVLRVLDRMDKLGLERTIETLSNTGLSVGQTDMLLALLDRDDCIYDPWFEELFTIADQIGLLDYLVIDPRISRGFDYYTGIVFESWARTGLRRALGGGGRYDNLTRTVGGRRVLPGLGFAVGDVPVIELLRETGKPAGEDTAARVLVTVFAESLAVDSFMLASKLRDAGIPTSVYNGPGDKLKKQLKYADRREMRYALILGPEEKRSGTVVVKDLDAITQSSVALDAVVEAISGRFIKAEKTT